MKKLKPTTALTLNAALIAVLGLTCIIAGLICVRTTRDIREMFESGQCSMQGVRNKADIQKDSDLTTGKERILFMALSRSNKQCIGLADLCVGFSNAFLVMGVFLFCMSGRNLWLAAAVRKQISDQQGGG